MRQHGQADLLEIVLAMSRPGGFPDSLNCRQEKHCQHPDDGHGDEELHQRVPWPFDPFVATDEAVKITTLAFDV
jgi:hypothetical protein